MKVTVGYVPYLNMVPFHQGFGPQEITIGSHQFVFKTLSPRALGREAESGTVDAGALSLVDWLADSARYEPIGDFGIGIGAVANSVLLFSKKPVQDLSNSFIAVSDETSTSYRLLQLLLEKRLALKGVRYGRIASSALFDGDADGVLLIGDEALKARREGIKGLPVVSDLGQLWHEWQGSPFVFALWAVRSALAEDIKVSLHQCIENSLRSTLNDSYLAAKRRSLLGDFSAAEIETYWRGFHYRLTPGHQRSIEIFSQLLETPCSTG